MRSIKGKRYRIRKDSPLDWLVTVSKLVGQIIILPLAIISIWIWIYLLGGMINGF